MHKLLAALQCPKKMQVWPGKASNEMGFMPIIAVDYRTVFLGIHHKHKTCFFNGCVNRIWGFYCTLHRENNDQPLDSLRYLFSGILLLFLTGIIRGSNGYQLRWQWYTVIQEAGTCNRATKPTTVSYKNRESQFWMVKSIFLIGWSWFTNPNRSLSWNKSLLSSLTLVADCLHGVFWLCDIPHVRCHWSNV